MRLVLEGFEKPVEILSGMVTTLQVANSAMFARLGRALLSCDGEGPFERFSLWEEGARIKEKDALLVVSDPLNLPFDHRLLYGAVIKRIEREFLEDEELRGEIERLAETLSGKFLSMGLGYNSDYGFATEWDFKRYLKMMGFGVEDQHEKPYLDNLTTFLSLALDARCKQTIVFVNLKTFLTENEFKTFCEQVFFMGLSVLLLENACDNNTYEHEAKHAVDLQFIES